MKMIKVKLDDEEFYMNIEKILFIERYKKEAGVHSLITVDKAKIYAEETPEQIVAMIHEVEGK